MSDKQNEVSQLDEDTFVVTSEKFEKKAFEQAVYDFTNKSNFRSSYLNESHGLINFKIEDVDNLAFNAQTSLQNILKINNIIRYFVNKNSVIGKVYESIETNVNAEWELSYPNYSEKEKAIFDEVDTLIKDFNRKINLESLITSAIPMSYLEGNFLFYLRKNSKKGNYHIDYYPLGVCEIADYSEGGEPYLLINIKELETRLRKVYKKTKKNQALFYANAEEEIKATYPPEVFKAFMAKEQYAILNIENSGVIRVNNLNRKYGLSPVFKALKSVIRLDNIELSDDKNTLVRGKKIIFQKLAKELITQSKEIGNITWSNAQAKSHVDLMSALNANGVSVYTGVPWVESVTYVEPKLEQTNIQIKKQYRDETMTALGIQHLISDKGSYGSSKISINELMKIINRIGEQIETILSKFYRGLLIENGIDPKYSPTIRILDSELLEKELRVSFATFMFDKMGVSYKSAFEILGKDYETELMRRKQENEDNVDETFFPRVNAYTISGKDKDDDKGGNPRDTTNDSKESYDENYNEENGR